MWRVVVTKERKYNEQGKKSIASNKRGEYSEQGGREYIVSKRGGKCSGKKRKTMSK